MSLLVAMALLCWPMPVHLRTPVTRAATPVAEREPGDRRSGSAAGPLLIAAAALAAWWIAGPMVSGSATLFLVTVGLLARSERRRRRDRRDLAEMLAATRTLGREIRAGAAPLAAIASSASTQQGRSARMLADLAVAVAGDRGRPWSPPGHVTDGPQMRNRSRPDPIAEITARLTRGWLLSARYGVPLAVLVDTVSADLADRVTAASDRDAQVAGPRVSGYVLAAMPALGVLLGVGMGADPLHVLFATGAGRLMLLTGTLLTCTGLAWTARIVRG